MGGGGVHGVAGTMHALDAYAGGAMVFLLAVPGLSSTVDARTGDLTAHVLALPDPSFPSAYTLESTHYLIIVFAVPHDCPCSYTMSSTHDDSRYPSHSHPPIPQPTSPRSHPKTLKPPRRIIPPPCLQCQIRTPRLPQRQRRAPVERPTRPVPGGYQFLFSLHPHPHKHINTSTSP
jgi:hypothetical protein